MQPWRYVGATLGIAAGVAFSAPALVTVGAGAALYAAGRYFLDNNEGGLEDVAVGAVRDRILGPRRGEEFAPEGYGTEAGKFLPPLILSDNEQAAVAVDLEPRGIGHRDRYRMQEVTVRSIDVGRGRLSTGREGNKQGIHTLAWTFVASALERLSGRSLDAVYTEVQVYVQSLVRNPEQTEACLRIARPLAAMPLGPTRQAEMGLDQWNRALGGLIRGYIEAYQLSSEGSMNGTSHYRGEDKHRNALLKEEERIKQGFGPGLSASQAADRAEGLIEVNFKSASSAETYARSVWLWRRMLGASYPNVMRTHGVAILARILNRPAAPSWQREYGVQTVNDLVNNYAFGQPQPTPTTRSQWAYVNTEAFRAERRAQGGETYG